MSHSPPLWQQLQAAAALLMALRKGTSATAALARVDAAHRSAAQALFYDTLRALARAEALRDQLAQRRPGAAADALLCVTLALAWRGDGAAYPDHTLVDQAVEAAKRDPASRGQAGFLNACLRRFLRERVALNARVEADPVVRWNHPRWWIDRLRADHPSQWQAILRADAVQAPMVLRVNTRRSTVADVLQALQAAGVAAQAMGAQGVRLARGLPVQALPGFAQGLWSVQDGGAQMAAPLLLGDAPGDDAGLRVLDACAAPGGKTAHLCELSDAQVLALDIDAGRCARIGQGLERLGLKAQVRAADAGRPEDWWDARPFDRILLDAPCSASGIVRRHPDVPWLRRADDIARLAAQQARLLGALWPLLRPGGRLLYCTCSVFRDEGARQIESFLAHNKDAVLLPSPGQILPCESPDPGVLPDNGSLDHDGFFYALLARS